MSIKLTPKVIKEAQAILIIRGLDDKGKLIANGKFDEYTRNALRIFQESRELEMTGELDRATLSIMMEDTDIEPLLGALSCIKMVQACMILTPGLDAFGKLIADGMHDETTDHLLPLFIAYNSLNAGEKKFYNMTFLMTENDAPGNADVGTVTGTNSPCC